MAQFDITKYCGKWYQLACYPSWYSPSTSYNTTALYSPMLDGRVLVVNSTVVDGIPNTAFGVATSIEPGKLRVDFPEKEKMQIASAFNTSPQESTEGVNYVVRNVWTNKTGEYIYAVVTDGGMDQFYLLARDPRPSLEDYDILMSYLAKHFDASRIVQTPHY